jgi:hypothetical protein
MVTIEANPKETISSKMVTNHPAGTATYTDIIKKTVARALGRMLPAKVSMD